MIIKLKYGSGFEQATLQRAYPVRELASSRVASLLSPVAMVATALEKPIGTYPLRRSFRRARNLVIVVPNRPCHGATRTALPVLIEALNRADVVDEEIKIMVATGGDHPLAPAAVAELIGPELQARLAVFQHAADDAAALEYIGETRRGTPVFVDKLLLDADEVIICGTIFHDFAYGYVGGPELVVPGCAGLETISRLRSLALDQNQHRLHPNCSDGAIEGNPLYEETREACRSLPVKFGLYTVTNGRNDVVAAFAGHPLQAYAAGCRTLDVLSQAQIREQADLTIVSCGGAPQDATLHGAYAALHRASYATRDGGSIIFVAACANGNGIDILSTYGTDGEAHPAPETAGAALLSSTLIARALRERTRRFNIFMVSQLDAAITRELAVRHCSSLQQAVDQATANLPAHALIYIIPNGTNTIPRLTEHAPEPYRMMQSKR